MSAQKLPPMLRYPGEGDTAFEAFSRYLASGWDASGTEPRRFARITLEPLGRVYGPTNVEGWFIAFDWELRAAAYDAQVLAVVSNALRASGIHARAGIQSFVNAVVSIAGVELERTLAGMRRRGSTVPLEDLVATVEKLTKIANAVSPPSKDDGAEYQPDLSETPDDELIRETALSIRIPPPPSQAFK